ncbi:MAG: epimerase [Chitinophagaceae bacterium]
MRHYLITGGAGFIGSNLIRHLFLSEKNIRITCIDNFDPFYSTTVKEHNISGFQSQDNFHLLKIDLAEISGKKLAEKIPGKIDIIVHLAAKAGVRPSIEDPLGYQKANVIGLQNMLDFTREKNIQQFVFASSSSVYGINDHFPWKEDEQLLPISPYAMTKLAGEMLGHVYSKLYNIRFIALRFFTVYGPAQRPDLAIHKFTKAILSNKPITMFGDGNTSRDYTFISDTVQGIVAAMNYDKSLFEIINLGNNYSISLRQLIEEMEAVTGKKAVIQQMPEQPGDVPKTFADISKAKKLLGYQPKIQLQEGLKEFMDWLLSRKEMLLK